MSSEMVTVRRTDPDGTQHTYAWPKSLADADPTLEVLDPEKEPARTADGYRLPVVEVPEVVTEPVTEPDQAPITEPAVPGAEPAPKRAGSPVTEPKKSGQPDGPKEA